MFWRRLERRRISRRVTRSTKPTSDASVTPMMAPLFNPEPSGDGMRPLSGMTVAVEGIAEVGTAGRSNAVEAVTEVAVDVGAVEDAAVRVRLAEVVGCERVGDVNVGQAPPVAVGLKD